MTAELQLPPGFRFHPTDEELVMHYLCRKCASQPIAVPIIAEIDLYKFNPWDLPDLALYGEKEWYFFSPRDRKYPNGSRPNRAAGSGYWKATGADKPIGRPKAAGIKKALVFYAGKAPKGEKTNWIMHEYRLADVDRSPHKNNGLRLDDWVLCRIYNKKWTIERKPLQEKKPILSAITEETRQSPEDRKPSLSVVSEEKKPEILIRGMGTTAPPQPPAAVANDFFYFDTSESMPRLPHTDSSCSEHTISPEFTSEVQSEPKWDDYNAFDFPYYVDDTVDMFQGDNQMSSFQDLFMFVEKPF
ncbi:hypothetical protein SLE2022_184040 [Rubroshorea leprosula]